MALFLAPDNAVLLPFYLLRLGLAICFICFGYLFIVELYVHFSNILVNFLGIGAYEFFHDFLLFLFILISCCSSLFFLKSEIPLCIYLAAPYFENQII